MYRKKEIGKNKTDTEKAQKIKREYVEAAYKLCCDQDVEYITIRQIAKITGRNSATLYYYFDDLRDLISVASIRYLTDY